MFNMVFVGVVRGLWGSMLCPLSAKNLAKKNTKILRIQSQNFVNKKTRATEFQGLSCRFRPVLWYLEGPTRKPRRASVFSTQSDMQAVPAFHCIRMFKGFSFSKYY